MYSIFEDDSVSDESVPNTPEASQTSTKEGETEPVKDDDSKSKSSSVSWKWIRGHITISFFQP